MSRQRALHGVLAAIGIGALAAYLVACRPAWSPDGSQVLFPYGDAEGRTAGIALLDRPTGTTKSVFVLPTDALKPSESFLRAQWDCEGKRVIAAWVGQQTAGDKRDLHVVVFRPQAARPDGEFIVRDANESTFWASLPEFQGALYAGGRPILRMDLKTWEVARKELPEGDGIVLIAEGQAIGYCWGRQSPEPAYEFGTLDPQSLALKPALTLRQSEVGEVFPLMAAAKDGSALAMSSKKDGKHRLLIVAGDRLQRTVPLDLSAETCDLGNLQWSPDGKTFYAALVEGPNAGVCQLGFAEIDAATGALRKTPLWRVRAPNRDVLPLAFEIALSPDGKTLAAATGCIFAKDLENPADAGLFLVDLTSPDRKVTRIAPPALGQKGP